MIVQIVVGICATIAYAFAYMWGGRQTAPIFRPRIWRRFIAPIVLTVPLIIASLLYRTFVPWNLIVILSIGTYIGAMFIQKYGGTDKLWLKIVERSYSGLIVGGAALPIAISTGSWKLFIAQVILAISAHLALGITNPLEASKEEFSISLLTVLLVPMMIFHV